MARDMTYAAQAMNGELVWGSGSAEWVGASLDSRAVGGGELFFALPGERVDGHDYVDAALRGGAAGAVLERPPKTASTDPTGAGILVDDSFAALHALTARVRREKPEHLVAVTGSTGKTTTKELLGRMLAKRFRTAVSPGNLNNLYGFPLAFLNIDDDAEWMVAEMGMSEPGELGRVSRLGRPEIAVYTNIGEAHLERLGSLEAVVAAKAELLGGLEPDGVVVTNADDPLVTGIVEPYAAAGGRVLSYGQAGEAVRIESLRAEPGHTLFTLETFAGSVGVDLRLHGLYNAWNFAAAATVALHLGVSPDDVTATGLEIETPPMRGRVVEAHGAVIVDDTYNSNPRALAAALVSAAELPCRRRVVVAGSMLELGDAAGELHAQAGRDAVKHGFALVIGVGDEARALIAEASRAGSETAWFADAADAAEVVPEMVEEGDVVLVKGSRGIGLEVVVAALERSAGGGDAV